MRCTAYVPVTTSMFRNRQFCERKQAANSGNHHASIPKGQTVCVVRPRRRYRGTIRNLGTSQPCRLAAGHAIDRWSSRCRARASLSWLAYAACTHRAWRSCGLSFVTTRGGAPVIKIDPRAAFEQLVHLLLHLCRRVAVAHHIAPKGHPLVVGNLT